VYMFARHFAQAKHALKTRAGYVSSGKIRADFLAQRYLDGKSDFKMFARYFPIIERSF
jgi:hypothetical protein